MSDYKSCDNCGFRLCPWVFFDGTCPTWKPLPCPNCGGPLSTIREYNGKKYRHCYACHFEFEVIKQ